MNLYSINIGAELGAPKTAFQIISIVKRRQNTMKYKFNARIQCECIEWNVSLISLLLKYFVLMEIIYATKKMHTNTITRHTLMSIEYVNNNDYLI